MKHEHLYLLLIVFFLCSCKDKGNNIPIFSYSLENTQSENYLLNRISTDRTMNFEYLNQKDSLQNLALEYNLEKDVLAIDSDTFLAVGKTYNAKSLAFKMYQTKDIEKNDRTLVFNIKYGLLASVSAKSNLVFLKDSITSKEKELFFKKLFRNLNEINIE